MRRHLLVCLRLLTIATISCALLSNCKLFKPLKRTPSRAAHEPKPGEFSGTHSALAIMPKKFYKPSTIPSGPSVCTDLTAAKTVPPELRTTNSFLNNCSGCHGTAGEGHGEFPAIRGVDKTRFLTIVRQGGPRMPAFKTELVSDEELSKNFELINSTVPLVPFDTQVDVRMPLQSISESDYVQTMTNGLLAWRAPGTRGACMSCHGPDGMDLARINYPTSAILRRAIGQGLSGDKSMDIAKMILAQRANYEMSNPCVASAFRPLQPGGKILGGANALDKDQALLNDLSARGIDLSVNPQSGQKSLDDAKGLVNKISALNVADVPIAISLNRWTEDGFHGVDHRSQAKWIPEIPLEAMSDEVEAPWIERQNAYLEDPSDSNLWLLEDQVSTLNGRRFTLAGVSERLASQRYKAVVLFQHAMRFNTVKFPDLTKTEDFDRFSIWETAQISNVMARGCSDAGSVDDPFPCWNYPSSFYGKMGSDRDRLLKDVVKINYPWLIAGLLVDPALQLTEGGDAQMLHFHAAADTFFDSFNDTPGQYNRLPIHSLFFSFVRLVKSIEATDVRLPIGPSLNVKPVTSCWGNVNAGLQQWASATLPSLARDLEISRSPAISEEHRKRVLAAISVVNVDIFLMIKESLTSPIATCTAIKAPDNPQKLKNFVDQIVQWNTQNHPGNSDLTVLASEIKTIAN